jgi:hypothetical protein
VAAQRNRQITGRSGRTGRKEIDMGFLLTTRIVGAFVLGSGWGSRVKLPVEKTPRESHEYACRALCYKVGYHGRALGVPDGDHWVWIPEDQAFWIKPIVGGK